MFKKSLVYVALFSTATAANAIELTDYYDPNTSFDEAYVDFSANANSGNQDQASYNAFLDAFYNKRNSTDKQVWNYRIDGNADISRGPNSGDGSVSDYGFGASANTDVYFTEKYDKLFYFGAGTYEFQDSASEDNIGVTVGLGYGRVWNATPLAKALRVQQELSAQGILTRELSDDELLAIAEVIGRQDEYLVEHGSADYKGPYFSDIEALIKDSGALLNDELGALGTVKLDEVLFDEAISARRHGWLVRGGAGFQASDFSGIADNDPKLLFELEYAKPYGLRGQLINVATYEPIFGDNTVQKLGNRLSYSYEVSDRIDWINSWDLSFQQADDAADTRFTSNKLTSTLGYNLTNKLDLGLTLSAIKTSETPNVNRGNDDVATSAVLGLRYRVK